MAKKDSIFGAEPDRLRQLIRSGMDIGDQEAEIVDPPAESPGVGRRICVAFLPHQTVTRRSRRFLNWHRIGKRCVCSATSPMSRESSGTRFGTRTG